MPIDLYTNVKLRTTPIVDEDLVNKKYVDDRVGGAGLNPTADTLPVKPATGNTFADSALSQTAMRVTSARPQWAITTTETPANGQTTTLFMNNQIALQNHHRADWERAGQRSQSTTLRNYIGTNMLMETNTVEMSNPPSYDITSYDSQSNNTTLFHQQRNNSNRLLLQSNYYYGYYHEGGYIDEQYGTVALYDHQNRTIVYHHEDALGNYRNFTLSLAGTPIINTEYNPGSAENYTSIRDGWGRERILVSGTNTTAGGRIDFRGSKLQNIAIAESVDDIPNLRQVRNEIDQLGQAFNKGELFPAQIVANRAAMTTEFNALSETVTEEFEAASAAVGVWTGGVLPVITNANTTSGWERTDVRASTGNWSIRNRNFNLNNTTATIVLDLGVLAAPQVLTWRYWIQAEECCDYLMWAVLNSADGAVVYSGNIFAPSRSPPTNWATFNVEMPAPRVGLRHQLRLQYRKDGSIHGGEDRVYIDTIRTHRLTSGVGGDRAWAFPDGAGVYVHGFTHIGLLTESRMSVGQSFRDIGAGNQLKMWNGTSMVNV